MELKDWAIEYVKARNAVQKTLVDHTVDGDEVTFNHKHKTHHFLISPKLKVPTARDFYSVVCLNSQENLKFLIDNWKDFLQDNLFIIFVNPSINRSWQIVPKTHNGVADPESLETGLQTMFSEVPEV